MNPTEAPIQQSTAVTDVLLAVLAIAGACALYRTGRLTPMRRRVWFAMFAFVAMSAGIGALMHGFDLEPLLEGAMRHVFSILGGLAIAMLVVGVIFDRWGRVPARRALPSICVAVPVLYAIRMGVAGRPIIFSVYLGLLIGFALVLYGIMALRRRLPGAAWMALGVLLTSLGGLIELSREASLTVGWTFDHNGLYHLVQATGLIALTAGLRSSVRAHGT